MTRLAIATKSVPGNLAGKLESIAASGFGSVELYEPDLIGFAATAKEVKQHAASLGLSIDVFQPFEDFGGLKGADRTAAFARLDQKIALMKGLGARTLLVSATTRTDAMGDEDTLIADFKEMAEKLGQAGCRAALIALPWARHTQRERDALRLIGAVDSPNLGLGLNALYSLADGSQAARLRDIPGERIFHVQLQDASAVGIHPLRLKTLPGLLPGQGDLNLGAFVRVVARSGYNGPWSISPGSAVSADKRQTYASDGYRALATLLNEAAITEPAITPPICGLPNRVLASGFEFIEFAVDSDAYVELTGLLSALSFRKERRHRTKAVELWRQGAVNIVVNSETKGLAAKSRREHGACVCDMGIRVQDADQTVKRASLLGTPAFAQPVGSGELDIPAIRGVGGSVVHFIDEKSDLHRVWDIEFDPVHTENAPQPAGLRRIDHVAQTMRYQDMQSWLIYYLSTFDMEKADVVDVVDPSGLVLSQALSSPEGEVRLNLNGADERGTMAGTFLSKGFGAGYSILHS